MNMKDVILVTGYEPFGGSDVNPSWEAAKALDGEKVGSLVVVGAKLPVSWEKAGPRLKNLLQSHEPSAVVCLGQSGRPHISPERIGVNVCNGEDNEGVKREEDPIIEGGPAAYFSTLPFVRITEHLRREGIPAKVSNSAGTYLCNFAAYLVPHLLDEWGWDIPAGFIHVPSLPEQVIDGDKVKGGSMGRELIFLGIKESLKIVGRNISEG